MNKNLKKQLNPVKPDVSLPGQEEQVLSFWKKHQVFEKTMEESKGKPFFSFYDGPPFATGLPHYGHLTAGILKDIVPRYWTMKGYSIPRRFGWDCHGLPVEFEINKKLNIDNRKQILAMGIGAYNQECRSIVDRYTTQWRETVERVGRWVDMDHPYFTMDRDFMESVWWVFQQLFKKGLVYEGHKVVPYSVGVSTPLSNFEANLNYKDVQDPALTVAFELQGLDGKLGAEPVFALAWTTTPWTLPSNLGLAVGEKILYALVKELKSGKRYLVATDRIAAVFGSADAVEVLVEKPGAEWVGLRYQPLFPYFAARAAEGAFRILLAEHVTTEAGTGIVHMAPAFGEEDFVACEKAGIALVNPVDDDGMFTAEVPDFQGRRVKEADRDIIQLLKNKGLLFKNETTTHSYPYCWRSDTPLIYRAVKTWFVKLDPIKEKLIANNKKTHWVPEHIRDGRFGNWLENARDWAISRNRFWGTPLPIWQNAEGEVQCIGSVEQLETLVGRPVVDLHLEHLQDLVIPSPTGKSPLKHVGSVLDCWFESGSMPYAQWGYPRKNKEPMEKSFPADFIAEGLDQTRGWFYTLMVISTALFDEPAFKNVIVNGLVLAEDGKKMSKSLRNYPDPMEILKLHGADALRLYIVQSPVVRAQELRFSEAGVREMARKILIRWWNAYSFFVNYARIDQFEPKGDCAKTPNLLDRWVLSRLQSVIQKTEQEMARYQLYNVIPELLGFVEELTNTYIRFNRKHFWQEGMPEEKRLAFETLYYVLTEFSKVMAPFTPFMAETQYQNLKELLPDPKLSVHLEPFPVFQSELQDQALERSVAAMDELVMMGRNLREKMGIKAKIPLLEATVIQRDPAVLAALQSLEPYFVEELNVRKVTYSSEEDLYVKIFAKANFPVLGKRVGKKMKTVAAAIEKFTVAQILELEAGGTLVADGESVSMADIEVRRQSKNQGAAGTAASSENNLTAGRGISLLLDPTLTEEQLNEGQVREVIRAVQVARKNADFNLDDRIELQLQCSDEKVLDLINAQRSWLMQSTLTVDLQLTAVPQGEHREEAQLDDGITVGIGIRRV